jgi:hypothetical protein
MNLAPDIYRDAVRGASSRLKKILSRGSLRGLEAIIQELLVVQLSKNGFSISEQALLEAYGGRNLWQNDGRPRIDVVIEGNSPHAIELKVVHLPDYKHSSANQRLWSIGQISADYWRIKAARKIASGELGILVVGDIIGIAGTPGRVLREFHNAMYLDYAASSSWGELRDQLKPSSELYKQRRIQVKALKEMGLTLPFQGQQKNWLSIVCGDYAYVRIPIIKGLQNM